MYRKNAWKANHLTHSWYFDLMRNMHAFDVNPISIGLIRIETRVYNIYCATFYVIFVHFLIWNLTCCLLSIPIHFSCLLYHLLHSWWLLWRASVAKRLEAMHSISWWICFNISFFSWNSTHNWLWNKTNNNELSSCDCGHVFTGLKIVLWQLSILNYSIRKCIFWDAPSK